MGCGPLSQPVLHAHVSIYYKHMFHIVAYYYPHVAFSLKRVETRLCIDIPWVGSVNHNSECNFNFGEISHHQLSVSLINCIIIRFDNSEFVTYL